MVIWTELAKTDLQHIYSYRIHYEIKSPDIRVLAETHKRSNFKADETGK